MSDQNTARISVGSRVRVSTNSSDYPGKTGTLVQDDYTGLPYQVEIDGCGSLCWFYTQDLTEIPTAKPWEVLREAIKLIPPFERTTRMVMSREADSLEAAAKPKPTLAEAAKGALYLLASLGKGDTYDAMALREALTRESA